MFELRFSERAVVCHKKRCAWLGEEYFMVWLLVLWNSVLLGLSCEESYVGRQEYETILFRVRGKSFSGVCSGLYFEAKEVGCGRGEGFPY